MKFCPIWWVKLATEQANGNNKINNVTVDTSATAFVTMLGKGAYPVEMKP
jgi:hypothetical protein